MPCSARRRSYLHPQADQPEIAVLQRRARPASPRSCGDSRRQSTRLRTVPSPSGTWSTTIAPSRSDASSPSARLTTQILPSASPARSGGCPSKTTLPRASTITRSQATSTSSTTWVEKSTTRPSASSRQQVAEADPLPRVEPDRRLVDDDHRRQPQQRPRHRHPLAHAAGEAADPLVGALAQADLVEQAARPAARAPPPAGSRRAGRSSRDTRARSDCRAGRSPAAGSRPSAPGSGAAAAAARRPA